MAMSAARSRRNRDAAHVVGGARWLVAELIRFDHRSTKLKRASADGGRLVHRGSGFGPVAVTSRCGTQSSTW